MKKFRQQLMHYIAQIKTLNQYEYDDSLSLNINSPYRDFVFRNLNKNDFYQNNIFKEKDRIRRYLKHFEKGHKCYGFETKSGNVAAYFWLTTGKPNPAFKGFDWLINHDEAYIWDCRTVPEYQRQGLYREGLKQLVQLSREKGANKIMISCEVDNIASDKGIKSAGFHLKGRTFTLKTKLFKLIRCGKNTKIALPNSPVTTKDVFPWT